MDVSDLSQTSFAAVIPGIRLGIGALLILAVLGKITDLRQFARGLRAFGVPEQASLPLSLVIVGTEGSLGILLLLGWSPSAVATASLVLFALLALAVFPKVVTGHRVACHCFELLGREDVGVGTLVRLVLLIASSGAVAASNTTAARIELLPTAMFALGIVLLVLQSGRLVDAVALLKAAVPRGVPDARRVSVKGAPPTPIFVPALTDRGLFGRSQLE